MVAGALPPPNGPPAPRARDRAEFRAPFGWLPEALGILGAGAVAAAAANLLGQLRPQAVGDALERRRAAALVRRHGNDTLSAFKLRRDLARRFTADGRAMAGYRIEAGAMLWPTTRSSTTSCATRPS
jgi:lysylphosphatidylglycerol synthetase-like protein (DUF2156 family)